jgi:predicted HicB family RNase H-like nuclease
MTTNILEYKDFIGSVNYTDEDECFYGKIEGINDLVTFEGASVKELKKGLKMQLKTILNCVKN